MNGNKKGYFNFDFNFFSELEKETLRKLNLTERCIIAYVKGWEKVIMVRNTHLPLV